MSFFTDFYNKVFSFFKPQENVESNVKDVARSRLKLVLMQDRTNLTPKILEQMRGELIDLLSKYVELDKELLELNFEQEGDQVALMLSIPVIRAKDEKEIEEAIKKDALLKGIKLADDEDEPDETSEESEVTSENGEEITQTAEEGESVSGEENQESAADNNEEQAAVENEQTESSDNESSPEAV